MPQELVAMRAVAVEVAEEVRAGEVTMADSFRN
jgi:hypothetical protein